MAHCSVSHLVYLRTTEPLLLETVIWCGHFQNFMKYIPPQFHVVVYGNGPSDCKWPLAWNFDLGLHALDQYPVNKKTCEATSECDHSIIHIASNSKADLHVWYKSKITIKAEF